MICIDELTGGSWGRRILGVVATGAVLFLAGIGLAQPPEAKAPANAEKAASPNVDDELVVELGKDERDERRRLDQYRGLISRGNVTGEEDRKLIADVVRWKLAQLTLKRNREPPPPKEDPNFKKWKPLHEIRADLLNDIKLAGSLGGGKEARPEVLRNILKEAPALLEGYHFAARLNCAILLAELPSAENLDHPYVPAHPLMIKTARDTSQIDAVRIWGVLGCRRLLMFDQTPAEVRNALVKALTELLKEQNKATKEEKADHDWLNFRIVEALGWSRTTMIDRRPEVVDALAQVIIDTDHPWRPRYHAAQAVGRLPLDGTINLSMISVEIVRLGQQIAIEHKKSPDEPQWKIAAWRIYFAFRPETEADKAAQAGLKTQVDAKGALGSVRKPVTDAYETVLPIVNGILTGKQIPDQAMNNMNKWLLDNMPKDYKVHPSLNRLALPPNHPTLAARGEQ